MRRLLASSVVVLLAACSATPPEIDTAPPPPIAEKAPTADTVCGDAGYVPLPTARQNASLAGDFHRQAQEARTPEAARDAYCAASVYLRWLLANDPTFTGADPDDRHMRRMADTHEFFAGLPEADRRAHLDSALALREQADGLRRELSLPLDAWAADLREGVFFSTYADAYEDASQREFDAFDRAFRTSPESIDDWYLRRLVELSVDFFETCEERADYLHKLAAHVDDAQLRDYVEAVAVCAPPVPPTPPLVPLLTRFESGEYADCGPMDEIRPLIAIAYRQPEEIEALGGTPDAIVDALLDCVAEPETASQALALFARSWRRGDRDRAEAYYDQALALTESNRQRADFAYFRASREYGNVPAFIDEALSFDPSHGPSLMLRTNRLAATTGTPRELEERAAYWCLADAYRAVAATGDPTVASTARQQAQRYEDAAPPRESWIFRYSPGDTIRARSGGVSCTTRVR